MTRTDGVVDVAVLGGGPGGYATALRAVARGLSATIVEGDVVGGTCLHRGCIPSKALLHVAHLADTVSELSTFGLAGAGPGLDVDATGRFRDGVVDRLHRGLQGLLKARGIAVVPGWGRIVEPGAIDVTDADGRHITVRARHVVVATGSSPAELSIAPVDGTRILTSDDVLRLDRVPASAVVVGGGAVGVELASVWRSFGAQVTIVDVLDRLLPLEDPESSRALTKAFAKRGIEVRTSAGLAAAKVTDRGVSVDLADGASFEVDQVLIAVGRRPRTADIGLDVLGVLDEGGRVVADELGRTSAEGVWAVGDVLPTLALAHAAFAEGFVVADAIAGLEPRPVDHRAVPRVTYCSPQVASVGLTEPEARAEHGEVRVTMLPMAGNAISIMEGVGGHVKLVSLDDGTMVGAHVVGPSATELIAELALATTWGALAEELGDVVHAHPSLSESVREAALAAAGLPFHAHS